MGRLHDRGPGPAADGLRHRAGPALPDPVRGRRGRHRLPPRPRHRGGRPGRDDGRRRREVRRLADDLRALLGLAALGRAVLRGARGEPRLADDGHAVRVAGAGAADRPRVRPDLVLRGDGRVVAARRRDGGVHAPPPSTPWRITVPRRAGCAAGSGATSRSSTARSTTSTSRCCGRRRKVAAMPMGPSKTRAIDHLHRGQSNDCYWHGLFGGIYISHMRLATYEHLIAAEDAADHALGTPAPGRAGGPRPRRPARGAGQRRGPGRGRQAGRGRRDRVVGYPGRASCAGRGAPAPARGVSRDAAGPRGRWGDDPARGRGGGSRRRRRPGGRRRSAGIDPRPRHGQGGRPLGAAVLRRPRAALGAGAVPRAGHDARGVRDGRGDRAGRPAGRRVRRRPPRPRPGLVVAQRHRRGPAGHGQQDDPPPRRPPRARARHRPRAAPPRETRPIDARLGLELSVHLLGGGGNPSAWYDVGGARSAHDGSGQAEGVDAIGYGNDWVGVAVRATAEPAADAWWSPIETVSNSESGFERVYQGSSLLLSWPIAARPGRVSPVLRAPGGQRRARPRGRGGAGARVSHVPGSRR